MPLIDSVLTETPIATDWGNAVADEVNSRRLLARGAFQADVAGIDDSPEVLLFDTTVTVVDGEFVRVDWALMGASNSADLLAELRIRCNSELKAKRRYDLLGGVGTARDMSGWVDFPAPGTGTYTLTVHAIRHSGSGTFDIRADDGSNVGRACLHVRAVGAVIT